MKYVFEKKKHKIPPCICELFLRHCVLGVCSGGRCYVCTETGTKAEFRLLMWCKFMIENFFCVRFTTDI